MAWLNREITQAANAGAWELLEVVKKRCEEFNAINAATALHRLSRHREQGNLANAAEDEGVQALLSHVQGLLKGDCNARAVSTIVHAIAGLGVRDKEVVEALLPALEKHAKQLDRPGLANALWALAKLPKVPGTAKLARQLSLVAKGYMEEFLPQELATLCWSLGCLGLKDNRLMSAISEAIRGRLGMGAFTPQGLVMVAAAYGRIGIFIEPLLEEIATSARERLQDFNGRNTVQLLWAFAKFKKMDEPLFEELCKHMESLDLQREGQELLVSFLWSFGTLRWVPQKSKRLLADLLTRAEELIDSFGAHRTVRLLTALAKLSGAPGAERARKAMEGLAKALAGNVSILLERMGAQELGISAWALATLQPRGWKKTLKALLRRAEEVVEDCNWWSIAHFEYAAWRLSPSGAASLGPLAPALTARCAAEAERVHEESDAFQLGPEEAVTALAPWSELAAGSKVLVMGPGRSVRKAAKEAGYEVASWKRFALGKKPPASAWVPKGPFAACALRYPDSAESFELALHAAASCLRAGAPLWVYGDVREGALGATKALRGGLFELSQPIEESGDVRIFLARRGKGAPQKPLEAWRRTLSIDLGDGDTREWVSYPGLFASGLVDVMTEFLLKQLQGAVEAGQAPWTKKEACRCLDFACGTGVLAAGLQRHLGTASMVLLDADAVALEAAKVNVRNSEAVVLSDGLAGLADILNDEAPLFDLVVSNPPVHRGHPDDLRVLQSLLLELPSWLAPGGELWLVAQEHIPTGRLFALAEQELGPTKAHLVVSQAMSTEDGRFVVWRAVCEGRGAPPKRELQAEAAPPTKKRRKS